MKIAEVCSTFPPYKGGMGNVAYHNAWSLVTLGHEVTVFTNRRKEKNREYSQARKAINRPQENIGKRKSRKLAELFSSSSRRR